MIQKILSFLGEHWKVLLPLVTAVITAVVGMWKYLDARSRELAWRRTEFMFNQTRYMDTDQDISKAVGILAGWTSGVTADDLFDSLTGSFKEPADYARGFDKLFNLLDGFAYALNDAKSVTLPEVANFGWYLRAILAHQVLIDYCRSNGFGDVIDLAEKVRQYDRTRQPTESRSKVVRREERSQ